MSLLARFLSKFEKSSTRAPQSSISSTQQQSKPATMAEAPPLREEDYSMRYREQPYIGAADEYTISITPQMEDLVKDLDALLTKLQHPLLAEANADGIGFDQKIHGSQWPFVELAKEIGWAKAKIEGFLQHDNKKFLRMKMPTDPESPLLKH